MEGADDTRHRGAAASGHAARVRIDKWLWAARVYRTRSLASEALQKNRVRVGGQRAKPSRIVQSGDVLTVEKGPYEFELTVRALADERRGAPEAALLYDESEASVAAREIIRARRRADREARLGLAGDGRPSRNQRRDRLRWQRGGDDPPVAGEPGAHAPAPEPDD